ncbi:histidine phosphatase family protein [Bilifractor sp. LCP21S3_A7]|uniref:histidine phosphatase family protein n=1 Tax=Bilifractor sp. LCP21S3_A7 TaxID=3438738 RepID=UPI003F924D99
MKIYAIRHGETSWNKERRLQGQKGSDLDSEGVLLAKMTAEALREVKFDICYTSPLVRARHTAEIILADRKVPVIPEPRIEEIGFGVWEGLCCDADHPERMQIPLDEYIRFQEDPLHYIPPEGGERIQDVLERTHNFYEELIHNPDLQDKTVLVSSHGCAVRAFLNNVYEDKKDFWQGGVPMNCSVSIIDVENGVGRLEASDQVFYPKKYYHSFYKRPSDAGDQKEKKKHADENK